MPKRTLKHHLSKTAKIRRNIVDDSSQPVENGKNENKLEACNQSTSKHMQYIPSNQNNEVERLLRHNSKMLVYNVDHSDFPAFNLSMWPQNCDMLAGYPTCSFSAPRPLYVADKQCEKIDICYKRAMNRHFFKTRMKSNRTNYQTLLKSNKNIRRCMKDNIYHYLIFDMAERIYMQPDPFFQSNYDYFFTGGNLSVLPMGKVIHAGGENLQEILISKFASAGEHPDGDSLLNIACLKNSENGEVFEYHPLTTTLNSSRQNCFIARQRNLITFNYLNDMNQLKTLTQFRTKSTPFISFAQSQHNINNFIITTMKQHIRLYDLSGSAPALIKLFEISPNGKDIGWNTVKPWRENTFMYANENQFFMIDIRTTPEQWLKEVSFSNNDLACEHISAVLPSDFNNLFYVATNHKLQCMDIRYFKKSLLSDAVGGISRWTHQLRYAPLMMDTFRMRQTEYVALSSPVAGDLHICQLSRERNDDNIRLDSSAPAAKHIYSSRWLPYQPPTLLEAYEHARLSGKCLRVDGNLSARIKCCTTGMKFFKSPNDTKSGIGQLLISNSNGDIFGHTLSKREDEETEDRCNEVSDEAMTEFERKICNLTQQPLNYTEIKQMKGLRKVVLCKMLSSVKNLDEMLDELAGDVAAPAKDTTKSSGKLNPKRFYLGRWQKSLSTLHSYKDALAADLLNIWDIDLEEENKIHLGSLRRAVEADPAVKVENWLRQNVNPDPPMLSIPSAEIRNWAKNTSNIFDTSLNLTQTQNTVDFEHAVHSTQILHDSANFSRNLETSATVVQVNDDANPDFADKSKNKKKVKKYVKGF